MESGRGQAESRQLTDEAIDDSRRSDSTARRLRVAAYAPALETCRAHGDPGGGRRRPASPLHGDSANREVSNAVYNRYTEVIRPFFDGTETVAAGIADGDLRRGVELVNASSRQIEVFVALARIQLVNGAVGAGVDTAAEVDEIVDLMVLWDAHDRELLAAPSPYDAVVADHYPREFTEGFSALVDRSAGEAMTSRHDGAIEAPIRGPHEFRLRWPRERMRAMPSWQTPEQRATFSLVSRRSSPHSSSSDGSAEPALRSPTPGLGVSEPLPAGVAQVLRTPLGADVTMPRSTVR